MIKKQHEAVHTQVSEIYFERFNDLYSNLHYEHISESEQKEKRMMLIKQKPVKLNLN